VTVDYRPWVLGTAKQIHALVCARDRLCDVDRLVGNRARVTGNYTRITMLTERTIATLVTLFKSYLLWSNSATGWWWELDQDVPQVLGGAEGSHHHCKAGTGGDGG
jgi:hypothetical protein